MDILECRVIFTRKEHECFSCLRVFPEGTEMQYQTVVDSGEFYHSYMCQTCVHYAHEQARRMEIERGEFYNPRDKDIWDKIEEKVNNG